MHIRVSLISLATADGAFYMTHHAKQQSLYSTVGYTTAIELELDRRRCLPRPWQWR